ncbi:Methyltransferase domain-containing protein [Candidatus Kryptonium thompsonii]|nr:Methyltransferase domain-containing protein [Candidatus Kryptonium thompsoni]
MPENGKFETYGKVKSASDFYDELSEDYMDMIEFSSKVESESEIFKTIVSEYKITRCLDAGCGVGLHSIILSKLGVEVLGIDISASMIEKARELAQRFGVSAEFEVLDFSLIKEKYKEKFELVLCIGNTLPNLINEKDLLIALRNFYNALVPNGILIAQILNYDKIMENEERIVNVRETPERIFVRFYDFEPTIVGSPSLKVFEIRKDFLKFNVLIVDKTKNYSHKLITTRIKPIKSEDLCRKLRMVGFKEIEIFGDFLKREFKANESKNIVVFARKT